MKSEILWLSLILWTNRVKITSAELRISCSSYFTPSDFYVRFDCASLNDNQTTHRDYFDNNVINTTTCATQRYGSNISVSFSSATTITLKNCRMPILPHHFLQRLAHAKTINLNDCAITTIDDAIFLSGLNKMSMSRNDLTELPAFLLTQHPNITEFDASHNRIFNIDPNTFRGAIRQLKIVRLSHNNIETIDEQIFVDAVNLVELHLGHNFIEHFRVDLSKLKRLSLLSLDNNQIRRLDCNIFELTTIRCKILVNNNHIREINFNCTADSFIPSLDLNANDNQLTSLTFPKSSFMNHLTSLNASRNRIERITFQQPFRQLTHLHLNANSLKDLAGWGAATFPKLEYLDITSNQFNCSSVITFLKQLPKTISLERIGGGGTTITDDIRHTTKRSKMIHGIGCVDDDFQPDHTDAVVERTIIWCLLAILAILFVAAISMKVGKFLKKLRSDRADPLSIYYENQN